MATKKKEAAQAVDVSLKDLSVPELQVRLSEIEENQFRLQFRHASTPLKNPMEIRKARREIARIKTFLHQKSQGAA